MQSLLVTRRARVFVCVAILFQPLSPSLSHYSFLISLYSSVCLSSCTLSVTLKAKMSFSWRTEERKSSATCLPRGVERWEREREKRFLRETREKPQLKKGLSHCASERHVSRERECVCVCVFVCLIGVKSTITKPRRVIFFQDNDPLKNRRGMLRPYHLICFITLSK